MPTFSEIIASRTDTTEILHFNVESLAEYGEQLRRRGTTRDSYKAPIEELRAWAKSDDVADAVVRALTHLGWFHGGSVSSRETNSDPSDRTAAAVTSGLIPKECFTVGEPVGQQIVACMEVLDALGAPHEPLAELWACYSGGSQPTFTADTQPTKSYSDDIVAENEGFDEDTIDILKRRIADGDYSVPDEYAWVKTRGSAQKLFADMVKPNYCWKCALTGIKTRSFLVASHIVPWSEDIKTRLDPTNGICLSTLVDRAFDTGFLAIHEDYTVHINFDLIGSDEALRSALEPYDGQSLNLPDGWLPNPEYLRRRLNLT